MRNQIALAIFGLMMLACATPPRVSPQIEDAAKTFVAPEGMARVYLFRADSLYGCGELIEVEIGSVSGMLNYGSFLVADLLPGQYQIASRSAGISASNLTVDAGKIYFVRVSYLLSPKLVDRQQGRQAVQKRRMVWSSGLANQPMN